MEEMAILLPASEVLFLKPTKFRISLMVLTENLGPIACASWVFVMFMPETLNWE